MNSAADALPRVIFRVLFAQALLVLISTAIFMVFRGEHEALSALFGGAVHFLGTWWMGRRMRRVGGLLAQYPGSGAVPLFGSALERFFFVIIGLAIGIAWLKFSVLPMLVTYMVANLGYIAAIGKRF